MAEALTCQTEQNNEVNHEYGPKDRNVEHAPPSAEEGNCNRPCTTVPEFEFWEPPYKGAELFVLFCG